MARRFAAPPRRFLAVRYRDCPIGRSEEVALVNGQALDADGSVIQEVLGRNAAYRSRT